MDNQILNHLEEITKEVNLGKLHREMVVMSGPQINISHYEPDVFQKKGSLSNNTLYSSGI